MKSLLDIFQEEKEEVKVDRSSEWLDLSYTEQNGICDLCKGSGLIEVETPDHNRGDAIIDHKAIDNGDGTYSYKEVLKQKCNCVLKKEAVNSFSRRMRASGLEQQLKTKTLKNFVRETETQKKMYQLCYNFIQEPKGLLALLGGTGAGKTHIGTATVGNLVYKGYSAYYIEWRSEWQKAQNNYQSIDEELMDKWVEADVLYIDDLFKNRNNDINAVSDKEFNHGWQLLDRRLKRNKITIISSEFTIYDFMKIDQSTAGRLIEMAGDNMINIEASKENNYRLRKVVK